MKKKVQFISMILIGLAHAVYGQIQDVNWSASLGGSLYEQSNRVCIDANHNTFIVGYFQDSLLGIPSGGFEDGIVVKYNASGQRQWVQSFTTTDVDRLYGIAVDPSGSIYVCGEFRGQISSGCDTLIAFDQVDAFVAKLDSDGQCVWMKQLGGFDFDSATDLVLSPSGYIYVGGYFEQDLNIGNLSVFSNGLRDGFVVKLDTNGQEIWADHIGGSGFDEIVSLAMYSSDSVVVGGNFRDAINYQGDTYIGWGNYDMFVGSYSSTGQLNCLQVFGGFGSDYLKDVVVDNDGRISATGWFSNEMFVNGNTIFGSMEEDGFLINFNPDCSLNWSYTLDGDFDERGIALAVSDNNDLYLTGTVDSLLVLDGDTLQNRHFNRPTNVMVARFTSDGQYNWATAFGAPFIDFPTDIQVHDDQLLLTGGFYDFFNYQDDSLFALGQYDIFTYSFQIDTLLPIQSLSVQNSPFQVYPNPFSDHLNIQLDPSLCIDRVLISTIHGQLIHKVLLDRQSNLAKISIPFGHAREHFYIVTLIDENNIFYSQLLRYEGM